MKGYSRKTEAKLKIFCRQNPLWAVIAGILAGAVLFSSIANAEVVIQLQAVKIIESSGNPNAFNSRTRCYGLYQISEICLREFNQINKTNYEPADLFDPFINEALASWYFKRLKQLLNFYNIPVSITTLLASYNWGIGNVSRWYKDTAVLDALPKETRRYIQKYQELTQGTLKKQGVVLFSGYAESISYSLPLVQPSILSRYPYCFQPLLFEFPN